MSDWNSRHLGRVLRWEVSRTPSNLARQQLIEEEEEGWGVLKLSGWGEIICDRVEEAPPSLT